MNGGSTKIWCLEKGLDVESWRVGYKRKSMLVHDVEVVRRVGMETLRLCCLRIACCLGTNRPHLWKLVTT